MISKNKARFIISLQRKKIRDEEGLYVIEGDKIVREFLAAGVPLKILVAKAEFISSLASGMIPESCEVEEVSFDELRQMSTLKTPHNALAVVNITGKEINLQEALEELCVALEVVQDPGNLGTIIRAAGWFGIRNIICSAECVDVYNPRVIQASMGALLHVNVYYYDLQKLLTAAAEKGVPVFGTMLEGESIYDNKLGNKGIILFGNESKGISDGLASFITEKIMIPRFSAAKPGIDSLNVGMAASVVFSEFRRRSV
jgi:TrmH family RNA methyltransferase